MKKICCYFIFVFCFTILAGCTKHDDSLILVTEAGFAPYEYYEDNKIVGVDIDIATEIANALGKKLVVKDVAFDSIINELNSGKADFAAAGMSITKEREDYVDFSVKYVTSKQVIVAGDTNFTKERLSSSRIAVQLGSVADFYVQDSYPNSTLVQQKKYLSALEDLKNGKVDCIIMDDLPARELVANNPNLYITDILFEDTYGMAVKKGNKTLLTAINEVLNRLISEGKIEEYVSRYSK